MGWTSKSGPYTASHTHPPLHGERASVPARWQGGAPWAQTPAAPRAGDKGLLQPSSPRSAGCPAFCRPLGDLGPAPSPVCAAVCARGCWVGGTASTQAGAPGTVCRLRTALPVCPLLLPPAAQPSWWAAQRRAWRAQKAGGLGDPVAPTEPESVLCLCRG